VSTTLRRTEPRAWSGRRDSNPRHQPWEAVSLGARRVLFTLSLVRTSCIARWRRLSQCSASRPVTCTYGRYVQAHASRTWQAHVPKKSDAGSRSIRSPALTSANVWGARFRTMECAKAEGISLHRIGSGANAAAGLNSDAGSHRQVQHTVLVLIGRKRCDFVP